MTEPIDYISNQPVVFMTPQNFLIYYDIVHEVDEDIVKVKNASFAICIIFMIIGLLNNAVCVFAFMQKKLAQNSFNWYLLVLSVFKLIFCLTLLVDYLFNKVYYKHVFLHDFNKYTSLTVDFIIHTSDSCISLLTIFLTLDRLYSIKYPLKLNGFITNVHATKVLISIALLSLILFLASNTVLCENSNLTDSYVFYCAIISPTLMNAIPLVAIFILNILLIRETIRKYYLETATFLSILPLKSSQDIRRRETISQTDELSMRRRKSSGKKSVQLDFNGQNSTRKSIEKQKCCYFVTIALDILSLLTSTPYYLLNSYYILFNINFFPLETTVILQIISSVLFNSNYCINFFLYFGLHGEFKEIVISIFSRMRCRMHSSIN